MSQQAATSLTRGTVSSSSGGSGDDPTPPVLGRALRRILLRTWPGRLLTGSFSLKLAATLLERVGLTARALDLVQTLTSLGLALAAGYFLVRLVALVRRHLLWRVRRKLILSYVFIGVVPAILIVAFFSFGALLLSLQTGVFLFRLGVDDLIATVGASAESTAAELARNRNADPTALLQRTVDVLSVEFPGASMALVPAESSERSSVTSEALAMAGAWTHARPPTQVPAWVGARGFRGLLLSREENSGERFGLIVRTVARLSDRTPLALVLDVPLGEPALVRLQEATGIEGDPEGIGIVTTEVRSGEALQPEESPSHQPPTAPRGDAFEASRPEWWQLAWWTTWGWFAQLPYKDWLTGRESDATIEITLNLARVYDRIAAAQSATAGISMRDVLPLGLALIAALFLVIQGVALVMGLSLARSITGSVHELFEGTERVMSGDFAHRIAITAKDQLGELADSFNRMTVSVETSVQQAAEKKRLEEELRIARQIQMSLLPSGVLRVPGASLSALCVPAREVGGDYYDFFELGPSRLAVLVADVSGKGTSAALYMAELKGLLLSLSQIHESPKCLLSEVNRIISKHLDSRSFITMTYAVVDLDRGTLTYARAGHTPLIHLSGRGASWRAQTHAPEGMVLGLQLEGWAEKFDEFLEERTLVLLGGDIIILYTDGVTEAMNDRQDFFGEERFCRLLEQHGQLPAEEMRERVLREIELFVGAAEQHDDMTMILLRIDAVGIDRRPSPELMRA